MALEFQQIEDFVRAFANDTAEFGKRPDGVDWSKQHEVQTDKQRVKVVPCTIAGCARPLIVSTFYVPAWAKCSGCAPQAGVTREKASVAVPQAGRTDPAHAVDLTACLVNPEFAEMNCLKGCGPMELKSVSHNDNYGPTKLIGYDKGQPLYKQVEVGETVMFQCNECRLVMNISTTAQAVYKRQNEVGHKDSREANVWADVNGERGEAA